MITTPPRRFWTAAHRYLGLAILGFLVLAAATGCVLCLRAPLDAALNPDLFARTARGASIAPIAAVRALEAAHPELRARSFPLVVGPGANLPVMVDSRPGGPPLGFDQVFLDGGDGHLAGVRRTGPGWDRRHLLQGVYVFHYTLLAGDWGRWIMGAAALGWLVGAAIGLYLTLPGRAPVLRSWLAQWAVKWTVKFGGRFGRLLLDLHRASGLWLLIGVIALAFTSVAMNFFDELVVPMVATLSPPKPSPFDGPAPQETAGRRVGFEAVLAAGRVRAKARGLAWRPAQLQYHADRNLYDLAFTPDGVMQYRGLGPISYLFDAADGHFVSEDNPYQDSAGRQLIRALYPLHTGQMAGGAGVAVIFILGLATIEMSLTGAYLWWVKRGPRVAARRAAHSLQKTGG